MTGRAVRAAPQGVPIRALPRRLWPDISDLPRNARGAIRTEALWAVFGTVVLYYAPLYMREVGLSDPQIGVIGSITVACSVVFQLLAAPITNRMGRKRTTLVWDLISWSLPMLVWALAQDFRAFVLAAVLNAANRIVTVSWSLLVVEDVEASQRARVLGILNLIVAACGLLTPLLGLVMAEVGTEATLRAYYALGAVGMTVMFYWRNAITDETRVGLSAMGEHKGLAPLQSLAQTWGHLARVREHPGLPPVLAFYVLSLFTEQMSLFQILYYGDVLGAGVGTLSLVPVVTAAVTGLMYGLVLRRLRGTAPERALVGARAVGLVGSALLLAIPAGPGPLLLVVGVLAAATFLTQTFRDAVLFARMPAQGGADVFSGVQLLCFVLAIPAGALAGVVYHGQPRALFGLIVGLNVLLLLLAALLARRQSPAA